MGPMAVELILGIVSLTVGLSGLIYGLVRSFAGKPAARFSVKTPRGTVIFELCKDLSEQERTSLIEKLKQINAAPTAPDKPPTSSKTGFVIADFFLWVVPSIIALAFVSVFLYLILKNQHDPNYTVPKDLKAAMVLILIYFFGMGGSRAAKKGTPLSMEELTGILNQTK
jgi:hypothetical protein